MDELTTLLIFMLFSGAVFFAIVLFWFQKDKDKIKVLYFETPFQSKILTRVVDETGLVKIGKKAFSVIASGTENLKPVMLRTIFGWKPFYRANYDSDVLIPFHKGEKSEISPQAIKVLGELTTLEKIATQIRTPFWIWLAVIGCGVAIGIMILYVLVMTGAITITAPSSAPYLPPIPTG